MQTPDNPNPYSPDYSSLPDQQPPPYPQSNPGGDGTGGIIPYKNPKALIAYYLGILSGLPIIGIPFGVASFVLGVLGLRDRKRHPAIKGSVHAWIGIGCGGFFAVFWSLLIILMIVGAMLR